VLRDSVFNFVDCCFHYLYFIFIIFSLKKPKCWNSSSSAKHFEILIIYVFISRAPTYDLKRCILASNFNGHSGLTISRAVVTEGVKKDLRTLAVVPRLRMNWNYFLILSLTSGSARCYKWICTYRNARGSNDLECLTVPYVYLGLVTCIGQRLPCVHTLGLGNIGLGVLVIMRECDDK
jgi:hypothetical protein